GRLRVGTVDLPFDYRSSSGTIVGKRERAPRRRVSIHGACQPRYWVVIARRSLAGAGECGTMRRGAGSGRGIVMRIVAIIVATLAATATAHSAEINAFISTAIKAATDELLPPFERANGHTIRASYAPSGALIPRFERGEPVDVFLTDSAAIDELIK